MRRKRPVFQAIQAAEAILPGVPAADGKPDPRWQAIIRVGEFVESDPEPLWTFALKWGKHPQADVRMAIATCLLEHLLERHPSLLSQRATHAASKSVRFARTLESCWPRT